MPQVTYVGHATVVIDLDGVRLITDPVLRPRVLHLRRVGRSRPPRCAGWTRCCSRTRTGITSTSRRSSASEGAARRLPKGVSGLLRRKRFRHVTTLEVGEDVRIGELVVERRARGARRGTRPAGSIGELGYRGERVTEDLLRRRHRPVRRPGRVGPLDLALIPVTGWGSKVGPGISTPSAQPRPFGCCSRGSQCPSTGARWRRSAASRTRSRHTSSPGWSPRRRRRSRSASSSPARRSRYWNRFAPCASGCHWRSLLRLSSSWCSTRA